MTGWVGARRAVAVLLSAVALLLQVNAPVHATLMSLADPDAAAALCTERGAGGGVDRKAPPAHHEACAACVACASAGPALAATALPPPALAVTAIAAPAIPREAAPRGPPAFAPRARGPPLSA